MVPTLHDQSLDDDLLDLCRVSLRSDRAAVARQRLGTLTRYPRSVRSSRAWRSSINSVHDADGVDQSQSRPGGGVSLTPCRLSVARNALPRQMLWAPRLALPAVQRGPV